MSCSGLNVIRLLGCMMGLRFPQTVSTLFEKTAYLEMPSSLANMQTSLVIESPFGVMFVMSI